MVNQWRELTAQHQLVVNILFFTVVVVLTIVLYFLYKTEKKRHQPKQPIPTKYVRLLLTFPAAKINPSLSTDLIDALSHLSTLPILELHSTRSRTQLAVICLEHNVAAVRQAILGVTNSVDIDVVEINEAEDQYPLACYFTRQLNFQTEPILTIEDVGEADPIGNILEAVMPLGERESFSLYIFLTHLSKERYKKLNEMFYERYPYPRIERKRREAAQARLVSERHLDAVIALSFTSPNRITERATAVHRLVARRFTSQNENLLTNGWGTSDFTVPKIPGAQSYFVATAAELAAICHPISDQVAVPGVCFLKHAPTTLSHSVSESEGIVLGLHRQRGEDVSVSLPVEDLQLGHAILLGKTRVGKTTLGHQMARDIKQLVPDSSLIILDPNGDWATDFALRSVRPDRIDKTYLLELGNSQFPPSLPILRPPRDIGIDTFINTTFETVRLIFRDQWSSTRMEEILYNTIAALAYSPGSTLLDIQKLYTNPGFRRRLLSKVPDEVVRQYWQDFDQRTTTDQRNRTDPILHRLSLFTRSRAIRNITCRADAGFDIAELIEEGADVLVSTVGADIHAESDLLIEFLVSRFHLAMFSRLGKRGVRKPVFLMIDESQHVRGPSLPKLLSEAAKTGLCVIALSQYLDQWTDALAQSILGNVGTIITFQVGPNDSRKLANLLSPFSSSDAENLDKYHALVVSARLRVIGRVVSGCGFR